MATSFYNDRDADLGEDLVKTLLETHQIVPDFLESLIPEGFTADGGGDTNLLKFDADSDDGQEENAEPASGGWGEVPSSEPAGWGGVEQSNFGAVSQPVNNRGAQQPVIAQPSPVRPAPLMDSWSVPAAPANVPAATTNSASGWGNGDGSGWGNGGAAAW